jgi:myo-inositol catabolism protein IolS
MKSHLLGTSDIKITRLIMGTWQAGKSMWSAINDVETSRAVRAAFDGGITTFDTAESYGNGHSERIVGETLADVRKKVIYATKVSHTHLKYDQVIEACHNSMKNLKTDHIDLYQIHWPSGIWWGSDPIPIEETMQAMNDLKQQGKIRAIGVCNFSRTLLEKAAQSCRIDSLQSPYSLFWRHIEKKTVPFCMDNNITILAYSPMAQGFLTGKFGPDHKFARKDHRSRNKLFKPENYHRVQKALTRLQPVAKRNEVTLGQLALAWVMAKPWACAISGVRNASQITENIKATEICLSPADLTEVNAIGRTVTDFIDDNPIMWEF